MEHTLNYINLSVCVFIIQWLCSTLRINTGNRSFQESTKENWRWNLEFSYSLAALHPKNLHGSDFVQCSQNLFCWNTSKQFPVSTASKVSITMYGNLILNLLADFYKFIPKDRDVGHTKVLVFNVPYNAPEKTKFNINMPCLCHKCHLLLLL